MIEQVNGDLLIQVTA